MERFIVRVQSCKEGSASTSTQGHVCTQAAEAETWHLKQDEAKERREAPPLSEQTTQPELYLDIGVKGGSRGAHIQSKGSSTQLIKKKKNQWAILPHCDWCVVIWAGDIAQVAEYLPCTKPWV